MTIEHLATRRNGRRRVRGRLASLLVPLGLVTAMLAAPGASQGGADRWSVLDVDGDEVRIYRDEFGVPHIFAETNRGLFEAYGYTMAEDRLWQLELSRRAREGRLAEVLGPASLAADRNARTLGYTNGELDVQFASLPEEEQEIVVAYVDGINRHLREVVAADPLVKLPFEFHHLQIGVPAPWTVRNVVAVTVGRVVDPPGSGEGELANQSLLTRLIAKHGASAAVPIFDDLRWRNDPDAPVSVPLDGAIGKRQKPAPPNPDQLAGASEHPPETADEEAAAILRSLGVPAGTGSHGWVVSPAKSATGSAMLFGGPQVGFNTPADFSEVQLKGGDGFDVVGIATPGIPAVAIGRTDHVAWTLTSAAAVDNTDTYIETLCGGGTGYLFNGACTPFETRVETINVHGGAAVNLTVRRTVHGPVVAAAPGVVFSRKRVFRNREMGELRAFLAMDRARNLQAFEAAVRQIRSGFNVLYADRGGNIAYWQAGLVPVRPPGFDPRLPLPGNGSAEWSGDFLPLPTSINPTRGWLANWNNKPSVDWDNPDHQRFGKQGRVLEIEAAIKACLASAGVISQRDMRDIATDIARTEQGGGGRQSRLLKPYLFAALDSVPPAHPLASQARAVLEGWDGSLYADARTSTHLEAGETVYSKWRDLMVTNVFADELGSDHVGTGPVLIHALDDALGGGSGVPPTRDYFNGVDPNVVMSNTFDQALTALGSDPATWSATPRATIDFRHRFHPTIPQIGSIPESNRGTYAQIVVLSNPSIVGENILTLGQSGFIGVGPLGTPVFAPHFDDQLNLYRDFQYKPMHLFRNTQLQE